MGNNSNYQLWSIFYLSRTVLNPYDNSIRILIPLIGEETRLKRLNDMPMVRKLITGSTRIQTQMGTYRESKRMSGCGFTGCVPVFREHENGVPINGLCSNKESRNALSVCQPCAAEPCTVLWETLLLCETSILQGAESLLTMWWSILIGFPPFSSPLKARMM